MSVNILEKIYNSILVNQLQEDAKGSSFLSGMCIQIFKKMQVELLPTPSRMHYLFNTRDLTKLYQGILQYKSRFQQEEKEEKNRKESENLIFQDLM